MTREAMIPKPPLTGIPRTGQTTVYQAGDDGTHQAGYPGVRFLDLGNGTILDRHGSSLGGGLHWVKQPELIIPGGSGQIGDNFGGGASSAKGDWATTTAYVKGDLVSRDGGDAAPYFVANVDHTSDGAAFANDVANWDETVWAGSAADLVTPGLLSWSDAVTECNDLDYNGYSDWRLPNHLEMISLYDPEQTSIVSIKSPFVNNDAAGHFWCGLTRKSGNTNASRIQMASTFAAATVAKTGTYSVIAVRGGILNG